MFKKKKNSKWRVTANQPAASAEVCLFSYKYVNNSLAGLPQKKEAWPAEVVCCRPFVTSVVPGLLVQWGSLSQVFWKHWLMSAGKPTEIKNGFYFSVWSTPSVSWLAQANSFPVPLVKQWKLYFAYSWASEWKLRFNQQSLLWPLSSRAHTREPVKHLNWPVWVITFKH